MTGNHSNNHHPPERAETGATARRRSPWPLAVVAALFIIVPFIFWYGTWFGRTLSDDEIENYLKEEKNPRHIQHALEQVADHLIKGDAKAKRWYPQLIALAAHDSTDVRMTIAWTMGQDNKAEEFHAILLRLLKDPEPIVRRNAALSLVRFGDASSRPELLAMLRPYAVSSPASGSINTILPAGTPIKREAMLARLKIAGDQLLEVRAPLPGRIEMEAAKNSDYVNAGEELLTLAPDSASVWESLRALYLVGEREDLPDVERYAQGVAGMTDQIKEQATRTAKAIQSRSLKS